MIVVNQIFSKLHHPVDYMPQLTFANQDIQDSHKCTHPYTNTILSDMETNDWFVHHRVHCEPYCIRAHPFKNPGEIRPTGDTFGTSNHHYWFLLQEVSQRRMNEAWLCLDHSHLGGSKPATCAFVLGISILLSVKWQPFLLVPLVFSPRRWLVFLHVQISHDIHNIICSPFLAK